MRLIDADKIQEHLEKVKKESATLVDLSHIIGFQSVVDAQPTAFDVDKVVEQLDEKSQLARPVGWVYPYEIILTKDVMKIVKAGGIDEVDN